MGKTLALVRAQVVIATRLGINFGAKGGVIRRPEYIREMTKASLGRINLLTS